MLVQAGATGDRRFTNPRKTLVHGATNLPLIARAALLALAVAGLLGGCSSPRPPAPPPPAAAAVVQDDDRLQILVFRGGRAAGLGHNHVLRAPRLVVSWPAAGPELRFRLDELVLDPPALRERLGPAFASRLDEGAVAATRTNMLKSLAADVYPEVRVSTLRQVGEGAQRAVEVEIELHGQRRRQWLVADVQGREARGQVVIRQSDFGLQPFSVLGGLLAVQDELVVQFHVQQP